MIRAATTIDLPAIAAMGPQFWRDNRMPGVFSPEVWTRSWQFILDRGLGVILVDDVDGIIVGCLGATITPDINTGDLVATEAFWWVTPSHRGRGIRLMAAYEQWARTHGAARCGMAHVQVGGNTLSKLYERRGFRPMDTVFVKDLTRN